MPTAMALLHDILRKKNRKIIQEGQDEEEAKGPGAPTDVQDVAVISAYAQRGYSPLYISTYTKFSLFFPSFLSLSFSLFLFHH